MKTSTETKTVKISKTEETIFDRSFPESSYHVITKPRGKSKSYKDYFGRATSNFEKVLRTPDAKNRTTVPSSFAEQIAYAEAKQRETKERIIREKAEAKRIAEEPRFASWSGNTDICFKNNRGPVVD